MSDRDHRRSRSRATQQRPAHERGNTRQRAERSSVRPLTVTAANLGEAMTTAVALHHAERYDQAERVYRAVLAIEPGHIAALGSLAMIESRAERHDAAIERLQTVLAAAPDHPGYQMNFAAVLDRAGRMDLAEAHYVRAIALAPRYPDPYYNLGDLYLRRGDPEGAIRVFDDCMLAIGREFHALAYKAHALDDAGRHDEARWLLNFDTYVVAAGFDAPGGFANLAAFDRALARHIARHPTLQANVRSTRHGKHTGELFGDPTSPMAAMEPVIHAAVQRYVEQLPDDAAHPAVLWAPRSWRLSSWGVVMTDGGHERPHIHPNAWLSGVFYVELPGLIDDPARNPEGWLEFGRPTTDLHVRAAPTVRQYRPALDKMFLFPSYFYHGTIPFRSEQRRICVAFDVEPEY
jgi:Flp pilus assembly protein TadD